MSILDALRVQKAEQKSIRDLAMLPQQMIIQMAQRGDIPAEVAPVVINEKARMAQEAEQMRALMAQGQGAPSTVMEKAMATNARSETPRMPQMPRMQQGPAIQGVTPTPETEAIGVSALPTGQMFNEQNYAGGGIVAFASRGLVDSADQDMTDLMSIRGGRTKHPYEDLIIQNALARGEDPTSDLEILYRETGAVANAERAISPKGARGIMQIMPSTAMEPGFGVPNIFELAKRRGIDVSDRSAETAKRLLDNPELNAEFGSLYRSAMENRFGGDKVLAAAAYNAGPGAVSRAGNNVPEIAETKKYVKGISPQRADFLARQEEAARKVREARREQLRSGVLGPIEGASVIPAGSVMEKTIKPTEFPEPKQVSGDLGSTFDPFLEATPSLTPEGYAPPIIPRPVPPKAEAGKPKPVPVKPPEAKPEEKTPGKQEPSLAEVIERSQAGSKKEAAIDKLEELLSRREKQVAAQRGEDKNLALLAAGLGMMAGQSPYALSNVGAGAMKGVEQYQTARKIAAKEEEDILAGRLGQYRYGEESRLRAEDRRLDQGMRLASAEEARVREAFRKIMENVLDPRSKDLKEKLKQNPDLIDQLAIEARNRVLKAYGIDIGQETSVRPQATMDYSKWGQLNIGKK